MNLCVKPSLMNWEYHSHLFWLTVCYSLAPGKGDSGSPFWKSQGVPGPQHLCFSFTHTLWLQQGIGGWLSRKTWVVTTLSGSGHNRITLLTLGLREAYVNNADFEPGNSDVPLPTLWRCTRHYTVGAYGEQVVPTVNQRGTVVLRIT